MRNVGSTPKKIGDIQFGLLGPQEIRSMSATKIITADTYDDDGFPIEMGLMDPRLGVIEPGLRCKTCGNTVGDCPGHFGHIDLAMPVIHVGYNWMIRNILRSTCRNCGRMLATDEEIADYHETMEEWRTQNRDVWELVKKTIKKDTRGKSGDECVHCGELQKKVEFEKPTTYREEGHKLTPVDIREWLERVRPEEAELLGLNPDVAKPEWMVLTVMPVPPVTMRPSITLESGERSEDDLTHKLVDVLRINQRLQENRDAGAPQLIVEDLWELLQYHITTCIDNESSGIPPARHRSGRPLKTLSQRLKGKEGRFRQNLSGKRVNFSARTVISPDPNISINDVGVPEESALELTVPLNVTPYNIDVAREFVKNGPNEHPGANYVVRPDGRRLKVTELNAENLALRLEPGYTIERHLVDGDIVLFNRQPSLHRMSILAHEVRVMPAKTFRINLSVCPPYNADFDGDEMNLHVLQSEEARAEAKILMRVQEHILSPRFGGPIVGCIHDEVSGGFVMTHKQKLYDKNTALNILSRARFRDELPEPKVVEDGTEYWTGKQLFSLLLPEDLNLRYRSEICPHSDCEPYDPETGEGCEVDGYVVVDDGELVAGTIDEKSIGAFQGEFINRIIRRHGASFTREFIDRMTRLVLGAIMDHGFSTAIDDEDIPDEARQQIDDNVQDARDNVEELIEKFENEELDQMPGRSLEETLELQIMQELGEARDQAGKIAGEHLGMENPSVVMARSGARGSMLNLSQMAGVVGQQAVRGERITRGYEDRTLPHFQRGDLGADAKGFVESSYKEGLSPTEFFFHSMGGREGLVDTAVRTARSGYMQRRLINALEDLRVEYDGTVRNTVGTVIQFLYGEDGIDPTKSHRGKPVNVTQIVSDVVGETAEDEPDELVEEDAYGSQDAELMRSLQDEMDIQDPDDFEGAQ
jgi:DNA-directed RNA polymerase subunit A'